MTAGPAAGSLLPLDANGLTIGRSAQGLGTLGGDAELSRNHARVLHVSDGRLLVEDLGSTNGTFVNGSRIPAPTLLAPGDELSLGSSTLRMVVPEDAPAPGPPPKAKRTALRIVSGWAPGTHIPIPPGGITLGRVGEGAAAFEGDAGVADEHVRVSLAAAGGVLIEDLGSSGGTLVAGAPIPAQSLVRLGERFQIGGSTLEVVEIAGVERGEVSLAAGGVREVPEGLLQRLGMRAPVSFEDVLTTTMLALGWSLALNLLLRDFSIDALDVDADLRCLQTLPLLMAAILPIVFNAMGFFRLFVRPDHTSMRQYLIPTFVIPALFIVINLVVTQPSDALEALLTVVVTLLGITISAPLMLKLRDRVARRRVSTLMGS